MKVLDYLEVAKQKSLWKKLRTESVVSVVNEEKYNGMAQTLAELQKCIKMSDYHPRQLLGHLGVCKQDGATRFLPIMSIEDFAVYYACVSSLQEDLCFNITGVYGAWRMRSSGSTKPDVEMFGDYAFDGSMSRGEWFKNWQKYSDLLEDECQQADEATFFHVTDIANFYDSIDLFKLENMLKKAIPQWDGTVDVLIHFLKYWNRTVRGYDPASKGLPQEIVGDASRILANFYLKDLDKKFQADCEANGLKYLRWADDITFIGKDKPQLEKMVYEYSVQLHKIGLNLNAHKTKCFSKKEIADYNCLDIIRTFKSKDFSQMNTGIEWFRTRIKNVGREKCRADRVTRHLLSLLTNVPNKRQDPAFYAEWTAWPERKEHQVWLRGFVLADGFDALKRFDAKQFIKFIKLYEDRNSGLKEITNIICAKPYTSPKAELLYSFRKQRRDEGMENSYLTLDECKTKILDSARKSDIISKYCTD